MASSEAQICNLALLRVGHRELLDDLDEDSAEAQACKAVYELTRDAVLEVFQWPFATRRATLAALSTAVPTNWTYKYALPTDCLAPRRLVLSGTRAPAFDERLRFAVEYDATTAKPVLLADEEAAELLYTAKVTNVALYSPLFVQALAWKLASELALSLPVKPQLGLAAEQKYRLALSEAVAAQLNQQQEDEPPESQLVRERA